jgi:hypothetical protein
VIPPPLVFPDLSIYQVPLSIRVPSRSQCVALSYKTSGGIVIKLFFFVTDNTGTFTINLFYIKLGSKGIVVSNTLDCYDMATITTEKSFIVLTQ